MAFAFLIASCQPGTGQVAEATPTPTYDFLADLPEDTVPGEETITTVPVTADEPVAAVEKDFGAWGYINLKGKWVIAPEYEDAYPFVDNVATVKVKDGNWRLINKNNETIADFPAGLTVVEQDQPPLFGTGSDGNKNTTISEGTIILVKDDQRGYQESGDLYGFADITGKIIVEPKYIGVKSFQDGLAAVNVSAEKYGNEWDFIDKTGTVVIDGKYHSVMSFSEDIAMVVIESDTPETVYIDKTGTNLSYVNRNGVAGLIGFYKDGVAPGTSDKKFGIIDKQGNFIKVVVDATAQNYLAEFSGIIQTTFMDGLYAYYDGSQPEGENGYFPTGFVDMQGNVAIAPQYDWVVAGQFSEGMCAVAKDKKIGFIDKSGTLVIPYQFDFAYPFTNGLAAVGSYDTGNNFKYIDTQGNTVIDMDGSYGVLPFTE